MEMTRFKSKENVQYGIDNQIHTKKKKIKLSCVYHVSRHWTPKYPVLRAVEENILRH